MGSPPPAVSWWRPGPGRPRRKLGPQREGLGPSASGGLIPGPKWACGDVVAFLVWSLRGTSPLACLPFLPLQAGLIHMDRPKAGTGGRLHPEDADLPPEIPQFPGVPAFPGHPRPHLGPSEKQIVPALSLPPSAGALPASPRRGCMCTCVCACVGAQLWLPSPHGDGPRALGSVNLQHLSSVENRGPKAGTWS